MTAIKGHIYEFADGRTDTVKYCVVVSNNSRKNDHLINIIMLGSSEKGRDVVEISNPPEELGNLTILHCGLITYCNNSYLVREIGQISDDDMVKVESTILRELDITVSIESLLAATKHYKNKYNKIMSVLVEDDGR